MWIFKQSTGQVREDGPMTLLGVGYAGREAGKNNPAMEGIKGVGPLPAGVYTGVDLVDPHPTVGAYAIHLRPDDETRARIAAYGRDPDSFFMHGDSKEHPGLASHGCIVLFRALRERFWTTTGRKIQVVA